MRPLLLGELALTRALDPGVANMACKALGYDGGTLYTYGASDTLQHLPIVAGYHVCSEDGSEPTIFDCPEGGDGNCRDRETGGDTHCDYDCARAGPACTSVDESRCTHAIDQGAICYRSSEQAGRQKCHTGPGNVGEGSCDAWHHCSDGCQTCSGCHFGCSQVNDDHPQDVLFGCVDFATTYCVHDVNNGDGSYATALRTFAQCSAVTPQADGYCRGSLPSAAYLSNGDVCMSSDESRASDSNIGFRACPSVACTAI